MNYRVLMVCMGNICRSPTAEGVLREYIKNNKLGDIVEVGLCGYAWLSCGRATGPADAKGRIGERL